MEGGDHLELALFQGQQPAAISEPKGHPGGNFNLSVASSTTGSGGSLLGGVTDVPPLPG